MLNPRICTVAFTITKLTTSTRSETLILNVGYYDDSLNGEQQMKLYLAGGS